MIIFTALLVIANLVIAGMMISAIQTTLQSGLLVSPSLYIFGILNFLCGVYNLICVIGMK